MREWHRTPLLRKTSTEQAQHTDGAALRVLSHVHATGSQRAKLNHSHSQQSRGVSPPMSLYGYIHIMAGSSFYCTSLAL